MRALIVGFAIGTWLLQQQSTLPADDLLWSAGALALTALLASVLLRRLVERSECVFSSAIAIALACACGTGAGFVYAALFAEHRLADELPPVWEGVDVRVEGVVGGLPAFNHSDRSVRFAFDVERVLGPED